MQAPVASRRILVEHDINVEKMKDPVMESAPHSPLSANNQCVDIHNDPLTTVTKNHSLALTSSGEPNEKNNLVGDPIESTSWHEKVAGDHCILRHQGEVVIIFCPMLLMLIITSSSLACIYTYRKLVHLYTEVELVILLVELIVIFP